jgi:Zn-dependent peptidase ImmA (M78 family)
MKHFSLTRIREVFPRFNIEPITENEFWRACKRFKIIVKQLPLSVDGYHERRRGRYYIIINKRLTGDRWLHTALHEFCHFLFDVPDHNRNYVFFRDGSTPHELTGEAKRQAEKREKFADAFAVCGLLPFPEIQKLEKEDLSHDPALAKLCLDRIAVLTEFKI